MKKRKLFQKNLLKNKKGITLVALVISIIVMLILAGVSLNATIGENGIMTQAKNATYMQGITTLEEYLQTEYVKYYDEAENYTNKVELLVNKISNLCLKNGTKNYITYDGKMYYLINKQALPEEIRNQLRGGDTTDYSKYIRLIDVYGVTNDLKVYYLSNGNSNVLGTENNFELDPNTPLPKLNTNSELRESLKEILSNMGIKIEDDEEITVGNVSGINEITLDGAINNITSLSGISELTKLKKVTLKNLKLSNLEGIQSCTLLNYLYLYNTEIEDYMLLAQSLNLKELYINFEGSIFNCNEQVDKLASGMQNSEIDELNKMGIFGVDVLDKKWDLKYDSRGDEYTNLEGLRDYISNKESKLTSISTLKKLSSSIKSSIQYLYLNNNNLTENGGLEVLSDFSNLEYLIIANNKNLNSLDGLENLKIKKLYAQGCDLKNLNGLIGNNNLEVLSIKSNKNLTSLEGIDLTNLKEIRALDCKISDITALENSNVEYLSLSSQNQNALLNVASLQNCTNIKYLYLGGNTNIKESEVILIKNILLGCGTNYSLDKKYSLVLLEQSKCNLKGYDLTSEQFLLLKNNTYIEELDLTDNDNLSNDDFEDVLSTCTNIKRLTINNPNLTTMNFIKSMPELWYLDIRGCSNLSDLSILNELSKNKKLRIGEILLDNDNIDLTSIQYAMNDIYSRYAYGGKNGIRLYTKSLVKQLEKCTELTSIACYGGGIATNIDLDLSNLSKLTTVIVCTTKWNMTFPESLETYKSDSGSGVHNFSKCKNLKNIAWSFGTPTNKELSEVFSTINNNANSELVIEFSQINFSDSIFDISNLKDSNVKSITITCTEEFANNNLRKIIATENIPNLKNISIKNCKKIENIEFNSLSSLEKLEIENSSINSLDGIKNISTLKVLKIIKSKIGSLENIELLSNIENLNLYNNNIGNIENISNLSHLTTLNLENNNIANLEPLKNLKNLENLNVSDNSLENYYFTVNNVKILEELNKQKLNILNINKNNFSDISSLKKLKWKSFIE